MAFNPSPEVQSAHEISQKYKKSQVIIIMLDSNNKQTLEYASYGKTKQKCKKAQMLADVACSAIYKYLEEWESLKKIIEEEK